MNELTNIDYVKHYLSVVIAIQSYQLSMTNPILPQIRFGRVQDVACKHLYIPGGVARADRRPIIDLRSAQVYCVAIFLVS